MQSKRALAALLVALVVVGATPALAAIASYSVPTSGEVPLSTGQTPTISLAGDAEVNLRDAWQGDQLVLNTSQGNITVSGDPGASARLAYGDITGTQTQVTEISAGSNWLELNPEDKQRVDVRGDADALAFESVAVDDGSTDLQLTGPNGGTAELRIYGLSANTAYTVYDPSTGQYLGRLDAGANGVAQGDVDLPDGSHSFEVRTVASVSAPTLSNASPTGQVTTKPDTLSVNISAEGHPTTVEFFLEGTSVGSKETTQNGTVSVDITGEVDELGAYEWSATATDGADQTDSLSASFETPSNLTLREETAPQELINDSTVQIRFFSTDGDIVIERSTSDGTINLTGLPDSEFVLFAQSDNHYDRRVYAESIFQQRNVYLLNETRYPRANNTAVRSRFVYEDLTGSFPREDTTIQIERAVDLNGNGTSSFRVMAGDFWGAGGEFSAVLQSNVRYRIIVVNRETGQRQNLGTHFPTDDLTRELRVSGLSEEVRQESGVVAVAELNESDQTIDYRYADPADETEELRVRVTDQAGNTTIYSETIPGPLGVYQDSVNLSDNQTGETYVVRFNASDRHQSSVPVGSGVINLPFIVPPWVLTLLMSMLVTFVGGLYGPRTAALGAWAMVIVAGGAALFGFAFGGPSVIIAALVAAGTTFISRAV